ncbi:MAG: S8 family serine peptidase [Meiothermus sp.]|uniref:S8 family serine peptidase n=1 Tax=Meiothermus sp. TaxID=1955249 RepID=UPI00298F0816|nr:S8 family serine peptidase [Meiothermus sp.]MCX7740352.1 S8 family serine peptidase [Meiothermus sp.]MDW8482086.1 S8 family serine peptidase [Meiothermus sp.]
MRWLGLLGLVVLAGCAGERGLEAFLEPPRLVVDTGGSAALRLQLNPSPGAAFSVRLALEGPPEGLSLGLETLEVAYPTSLSLSLRVSPETPPGDYAPALLVRWGRGELRLGFALRVVRACAAASGPTYLLRQGEPVPPQLTWVRPSALPGFALYRLREGAVPTGLPYRRLRLFRQPNDPLYPRQWYLRAIGMERAWAVETGVGKPIWIGAVDSGVLPHPDLGRVEGYDFVSDPQAAGDCDGRDPDPSEPLRNGELTGFHGTQVMGLMLAKSDNQRGIAGVHWGAGGVMARAFGGLEGDDADAIEALLWLAGLPVPGVPLNPYPVRVINLSFGGEGTCPPGSPWYEATRRVLGLGVVLVAAAGNQNRPAEGFEPASCPGVIAVGATDALNRRASYANYGPRVDLYAPGGMLSRDDDNDGQPDGLLSLGFSQGAPGYAYVQGTSFAAPLVGGAAALLLSREPGLSPAGLAERLRGRARPLPPESCAPQACEMRLLDVGRSLEP